MFSAEEKVERGTEAEALADYGNSFGTFGEYFERKIRKLDEQFTARHGDQRGIFSGVSIFVDGFTSPPKNELGELMGQHGGNLDTYYSRNRTTHIVAENLPRAKVRMYLQEKQVPVVVHTRWILDSIEQGKVLPTREYILDDFKDKTQKQVTSMFGAAASSSSSSSSSATTTSTTTATTTSKEGDSSMRPPTTKASSSRDGLSRGPAGNVSDFLLILPSNKNDKFMEQFYSASRLHHIGSWRGRLQKLVSDRHAEDDDLEAAKFGHCPPPAGQPRTIVHIDMDCFFASVSLRDKPDLQQLPVVVAHSGQGNGEISAANYPARAFGVKAGMWMLRAKELCPDLQAVPYEFDKYEEVSLQLYRILFEWSAQVQAVSCDEALLDLSDAPDPEEAVRQIRQQIMDETGCPASAGIGPNILLARIATRKGKPNGQCLLSAEEAVEYLSPLPVREIPGVGRATARHLSEMGVETCAQLQALSKETLQSRFGSKTGLLMHEYCRGVDRRSLDCVRQRQSIATEVNWGVRFSTSDETHEFLEKLAAELAKRMREEDVLAGHITLKIMRRRPGAPNPVKFLGHGVCDTFSKGKGLPTPTGNAQAIFIACRSLLQGMNIPPEELRGVGIHASKLHSCAADAGKPKQSSQDDREEERVALFSSLFLSCGERKKGKKETTCAVLQFGAEGAVVAPAVQREERDRQALPSYSQVDQEVLAALPSDIRDEYQRVFDHHKRNKMQKEKQQPQETTGPLDTMVQRRAVPPPPPPPAAAMSVDGAQEENGEGEEEVEGNGKGSTRDLLVLRALGIDLATFRELPEDFQGEVLAEAEDAARARAAQQQPAAPRAEEKQQEEKRPRSPVPNPAASSSLRRGQEELGGRRQAASATEGESSSLPPGAVFHVESLESMKEALSLLVTMKRHPLPVHAELVLQGVLSLLAHRHVDVVERLLLYLRRTVTQHSLAGWRVYFNRILRVVNSKLSSDFLGGAPLARVTPLPRTSRE